MFRSYNGRFDTTLSDGQEYEVEYTVAFEMADYGADRDGNRGTQCFELSGQTYRVYQDGVDVTPVITERFTYLLDEVESEITENAKQEAFLNV